MKQEIKEQTSILGDKLTLAWYFEKPFEKIILVLAMVSLILTIIRLIAGRGIW